MAENTLKKHYQDTVAPALKETRGYTNSMQIPRLSKVVLNCGVGSKKDRTVLDESIKTLADITGQQPVKKKARKSVSNFKLREGQEVGCMVTLRGDMMYNFLYRLINIALPRVRDFRGVSKKGFDGSGNYNFGLNDQSIFTEIDLDKSKHTVGMNITIVTTAQSDAEARELLTLIGMPFAN
jgi:large subunit ribosomal protein L5